MSGAVAVLLLLLAVFCCGPANAGTVFNLTSSEAYQIRVQTFRFASPGAGYVLDGTQRHATASASAAGGTAVPLEAPFNSRGSVALSFRVLASPACPGQGMCVGVQTSAARSRTHVRMSLSAA